MFGISTISVHNPYLIDVAIPNWVSAFCSFPSSIRSNAVAKNKLASGQSGVKIHSKGLVSVNCWP